jgi:pyridoxamine 5'-phosphate oxidase family protein
LFSPKELDFLKSQRLLRIATVSTDDQPHVEPVGFDFDGKDFYVSGYRLTKTKRYRNIQTNPKVALTIDDLVSVNPWQPRGMIVYGHAELVTREGYIGPGTYIRIQPTRKWSWGIEKPVQIP